MKVADGTLNVLHYVLEIPAKDTFDMFNNFTKVLQSLHSDARYGLNFFMTTSGDKDCESD